ncbi:hypothetical protein [Mucilaginibacter sp. PAMB04168]|uniref:hypothetical protein n=1 Tax=Mucilaginibacter sp. PAMB04168 TaxID=3138567 RepID=UPI0031F6A7F1
MTTRFKLYLNASHQMRKLRKWLFFDDLFLTRHFPKLSSQFKIAHKVLAQHFVVVSQHYLEEALPFNNEFPLWYTQLDTALSGFL